MKKFLLATALITAASGAFAATRADLTDAMKTQITDMMTADGYEVRSIKIENGMFEVYAIKDGNRQEIYLDDNLEVVEGKLED